MGIIPLLFTGRRERLCEPCLQLRWGPRGCSVNISSPFPAPPGQIFPQSSNSRNSASLESHSIITQAAKAAPQVLPIGPRAESACGFSRDPPQRSTNTGVSVLLLLKHESNHEAERWTTEERRSRILPLELEPVMSSLTYWATQVARRDVVFKR